MLDSSLAFAQILVATALSILTLLQASGRKEKYLKLYAVAFTLFAAAFLFFLAGGSNVWLAIIIPNILVVTAHVFIAFAFNIADAHPHPWPRRYWAYLILAFGSIIHFSAVKPAYRILGSTVSAAVCLCLAECLCVLLRGYREIPARTRKYVTVIFGLLMLCHIARIGLYLLPIDLPVTAFTYSFTLFFSVLCTGSFFIMDSSRLIEGLNRNNRILEQLAMKDELTGLFNRHSLNQTIINEMERQDRYKEPLSLILLDLDHFKRVNDVYGHDAGDLVLAETAVRMAKNIRDTDYLFRWGGEEFLIVLPHTDSTGAAAMAEKLRTAVSGAEIAPAGTVTASFGVAERIIGENRETWFKRVDESMYRAKDSGRNRVEVWTPDRLYLSGLVNIQWHEEWNSPVEDINVEHRLLVAKGNELINMALSGASADSMLRSLDELIVGIQEHFASEEKILGKAGYPDVQEHAAIHKSLVADALAARDNFTKGVIDPAAIFHLIVDRIIIEHMLSSDVKFFPFL